MRDLAKSIISWGWSMSVFSGLQAARMLTPGKGGYGPTPAASFNTVTDSALPLLTAPARLAMQAGVAAQSAVLGVLAKTAAGLPQGAPPPSDTAAGEPVPIGALSTKSDA